jgi:DNA-directed RNA polymerase subunit M
MRPRPDDETILCPKCGFKSKKDDDKKAGAIEGSKQAKKSSANEPSLKVMDNQTGPDALPTTNIECQKCKNNTAFWWMLQTRSADEPTTQFYRCTKCGHTWRNYA